VSYIPLESFLIPVSSLVPASTLTVQTSSPYTSTIHQHQHRPCMSSTIPPTRAEREEQKPIVVDESPGLRGLHGAANLLKEISQGWSAYREGSSPPPLHLHSATSQPRHGEEARMKYSHLPGQHVYSDSTARSFHSSQPSSWMEEEDQFYHDENHQDVAGVMVSALSNPTFAQEPPQLLTPLLLAQRHDLFAVDDFTTSQQQQIEARVNSGYYSFVGTAAQADMHRYQMLVDDHSRDVAATMTQLSVQSPPALRSANTERDEGNASQNPMRKSSSLLLQQYPVKESALKQEEV
jgi:hypothetical protein